MKNKPRKKAVAIGEAERTQVRARKVIGHDFALRKDAHRRERLVSGTAESQRRYELGVLGDHAPAIPVVLAKAG